MVICGKKQKNCQAAEMTAGDCRIWLSLDSSNGLILSAQVGKRVDRILEELVISTKGRTDCRDWNTDG